MKRPRIVLDALLVHERPTGVARSILELTRALAAEDRGLDFVLLATVPRMFDHLIRTPGWQVLPCPGGGGGTLRKAWFTQRHLPRLCRELGADILHSMQFVAPLRPVCRSVVTVHDLAWQLHPGTVEQPRRAYYRYFVPRTLDKAQAILTNSEATAADVRRLHPRLSAPVVVTPFATPSWVWEAGTTAAPESAPLRRFLFVGTLEPRKNLEGLLAAYERARNEWRSGGATPDFPSLLLVGGKGWRDSNLRRTMDRLQGEGCLEVRDYCHPEELWSLYRSSLALLFPSLHEGFGFPILEGMAAGLPVLTSGRGAMAEVAGAEAVLVDPDDTASMAAGMVRLAADEDLRRGLAERGPLHARTWNWDRTARETLTVYRGVLDAPGAGATF